ncbi:rubredoxin [Sphaerotilus sp.]|uniref:rubredoxin n=1 Tax=Sphaerotilus sp. TaxID=2093942 RepID=UPI002ACEEF3B|nr:rubredoxin [Sphaerotilus sp.]MDZ7858318.1 rubredoxin [Sphaerotilus sp.]
MSTDTSTGGFRGFEGSYLGDAARLPADARLECKICWWVYDPAVGDEVWQVAPGTAFTALPAHWRCPQCDGDATQFMVLGTE